jgi:UrcA family protein
MAFCLEMPPMNGSKFATFALAAAGALTLLAAPAPAQDYYRANQPVYDDEEDIVVTAPGVHREITGRSASTGAPIETLTEQRVVTTDDLDLRYDGDVQRLYRRIDRTVAAACRSVERRVDTPLDDDRDCVRDARNDAFAQADHLIAEARG